jgi:hypothetical protein
LLFKFGKPRLLRALVNEITPAQKYMPMEKIASTLHDWGAEPHVARLFPFAIGSPAVPSFWFVEEQLKG